MKNDKNDSKKTGKPANVKSLYTVLVLIALTLVLITKFISDNDLGKLSVEDDYSNAEFSFSIPEFTQPPETADVHDNITGIADTRPNTPVTESTTEIATVPTTLFEAAVPYESHYNLPLGEAISRGYSDSTPVYNATMQDWRAHNAVDFAGVKGDRVAAISPGEVTSVYYDLLYGTVAVIDHGNGVVAYYCGIAPEGCVEEGDIVEMSDTVGYLDTVPFESADESEHLHFEITVDGKKADPLAVMGKKTDN